MFVGSLVHSSDVDSFEAGSSTAYFASRLVISSRRLWLFFMGLMGEVGSRHRA